MNSKDSSFSGFQWRVLVVDDDKNVHQEYVNCLNYSEHLSQMDQEKALFDEEDIDLDKIKNRYAIDHAFQGAEAIEKVKKSCNEEHPYALIFLDLSMPPGINGIEALKEIWDICPEVEVVLCSAYSEYSWDEILKSVGINARLMFLPKPFNPMSIQQMALSLTNKWSLNQKTNQLHNDLEILVEKRTAQLKDSTKAIEDNLENMKQMQSMLVESEKMAALGNLVAGVAHEINTPLGIGITGTSFLEEKILAIHEDLINNNLKESSLIEMLEAAKESIDLISSNLERAADLVKSFKQVAADQSHEEIADFSFESNIKKTLTSLGPTLKNIEVKIKSELPKYHRIHSYPGSLSQIIVNLVINAQVHAFNELDKGRIDIHVSLEENQDILFSFRDNGKGMPQQTLNKVFDPFFTTKRGKGGTGLGCHIIYNLVRQKLKGKIICTSTLGEGTEFLITIPSNVEDAT